MSRLSPQHFPSSRTPCPPPGRWHYPSLNTVSSTLSISICTIFSPHQQKNGLVKDKFSDAKSRFSFSLSSHLQSLFQYLGQEQNFQLRDLDTFRLHLKKQRQWLSLDSVISALGARFLALTPIKMCPSVPEAHCELIFTQKIVQALCANVPDEDTHLQLAVLYF